MVKLFNRHAARGWDKTMLKYMIIEANKKSETEIKTLLPGHSATLPVNSESEDLFNRPSRLFIHMEYSRDVMPKKAMRSFVDGALTKTREKSTSSKLL